MSKIEAFRMNPVAPMTVGMLRMILAKVPASAKVILFSDSEGNDIKPLLDVGVGKATIKVRAGYADVQEGKGPKAVFLWPYD